MICPAASCLLRAASLLALLLPALSARAQPGSPTRRAAALSLPFFDDFSRLDTLDAELWSYPTNAVQNNDFPVDPPSRGVVTFESFKRNGAPYAGAGAGIGGTDTLTSQPINLSGQANVVLSFWWQAGSFSVFTAPSSSSRLYLDFDDGTDFWTTVWTQGGNGQRTPFQQTFVSVPSLYLSGNFRFRFRIRGTQNTYENVWNVDYIELDANRQPQPAGVTDVATSRKLPSALERYAAMPVWQFNAAPNRTDELNDSTGTTLNNLSTSTLPLPIAYKGWLTVRDVAGVVAEDTFLRVRTPIGAGQIGLPAMGSLRNTATQPLVPNTPDYKTLTQTLLVTTGEPSPSTRYNDVMQRVTELRDYYAYDDGTAETDFPYAPSIPTSIASGFTATTTDQVAAVAFYFPGYTRTGQTLFATVWADDPQNPGQPAPMPLARIPFPIPPENVLLPLGRMFPVWLPQPIPVNGRFYVGYDMPSNASQPPVNLGVDLNNGRLGTRQLFIKESTGSWRTLTDVPGALMVRAVMNNNGLLGLPETARPEPSVYPNPVSMAEGAVRLEGAFTGATLLDALGRPVRTVEANAPTLEVLGLSAGVYVLRFRAADGRSYVRRLVITQ